MGASGKTSPSLGFFRGLLLFEEVPEGWWGSWDGQIAMESLPTVIHWELTKCDYGRNFSHPMKKTILSTLLVAVVMTATASAAVVASYTFTGNFNDSSTQGNNLNIISSGTHLTTDRFGNENSALYITAIDDFAQTSQNIGLVGNVDHTISLWVKTESQLIPANMGNLVSFGNGQIGGINNIVIDNQYDGRMYLWGSYADQEVWSLGNPFYQQWHQIIYSYGGSVSASKFYIDGVEQKTYQEQITPYSDTFNIQNSPFTVGMSTGAGWWFGAPLKTSIDDIYIYDTALTSQQAAERFTIESVPEPSTYALFGIGAIGMLMVMRRKKAAV